MAKQKNLPLKLPVLAEDLPIIKEENTIPLEIILRGLRAQYRTEKDSFYRSYLRYFVLEKFKLELLNDNVEQAAELLEEASRYGRDDYILHLYKGLLLKKKGEMGEAEAEIRLALSMNPASPIAPFELGRLLEEKDDIDSALDAYTMTLERDKKFIPAYVACGDIFFRVSDFASAISFYEKVLSITKDFLPPYVRLGVIYNREQKFDKAGSYFERGLKRFPDDYELNYNIAFTYTRLSRLDKAAAHLKKAIEISPDKAAPYNELGIIYKNTGLYQKAISTFKTGMEIESSNILKWNLSWALALNGEYDMALKELDELEDDLIESADYLKGLIEKDMTIQKSAFSIEKFSDWVLEVYGEIEPELKARLSSPSHQNNLELNHSFDLILLPLINDLLKVYRDYPLMLMRALTLFSCQIAGSQKWLAFSRFLVVVSGWDTPFMLLETEKEELVETLVDIDWQLTERLARLDRDSFKDYDDLLEEPLDIGDHKNLMMLILNLLWIQPDEAEIGEIASVYDNAKPLEELLLQILKKD